jgi:hypothetical protein
MPSELLEHPVKRSPNENQVAQRVVMVSIPVEKFEDANCLGDQ